ncbi:MAG TPA: DUF2442 domain-containing protein [Clostridiaceae bacterium]
MNPRVKEVEPLENHKLLLTFTNEERRIFDVEPLINKRKRFKELENPILFNTVKASHGTVEWIHEQDICPDWLYEDSISI